jgi:hypothetical protein
MAQQDPDWIKTGLTFFGLFLMYKVDFTNENNVLLIRILFGISQFFVFLGAAYLYFFKINALPDGGPKNVKVVPKASFMETPDPSNFTLMTVKEYDLSQLKALLTTSATTIAITLFIHVKFAIVPPLLMQALLAFASLHGNPLVQAYVLNKEIARPFPEAPGLLSGLSAMTGEQNNQTEQNVLEVEDEDSEKEHSEKKTEKSESSQEDESAKKTN